MKNKTTAALLALFLGVLGVHRFYLKQFWLGLLYLLTLGFYGIGALIDFIVFITMKDERFDEKYNSKYLYLQQVNQEHVDVNVVEKAENEIAENKVLNQHVPVIEEKQQRFNKPAFQTNEKNVKGVLGLIFIIFSIWFWFGGGFFKSYDRNLDMVENKVAKDTEKQYYVVKRMGTKMEIYIHAGFVKAAYLQLGDDENYKKWSKIEKEDGKNAGMPNFE